MTRVLTMDLAGLAHQLERDAVEFPREIERGLFEAAQRGVTLLAELWPVYTGQSKASWGAHKTPGGAELDNPSPIAGITEAGARPHAISAEGMIQLERWVELVLGDQVASIAGQRQTYVGALKAPSPSPGTGGWMRDTGGSGKGGRLVKADYIHEAIQELAFLIAKKIKDEGQKPLWIVRDNLDKLGDFAAWAIARHLGEHHDRGGAS